MKAARRAIITVSAALLATAGAMVISAPAAQAADSYVTCPSTDPGFLLGAGPSGAAGVDTGSLLDQTVINAFVSTCRYGAAYWTVTLGYPKQYPGRYCTWYKDLGLIGGLGSRYGVSCH